jgi:hypothetical protein
MSIKNGKYVNCRICNKEFYLPKSLLNQKYYCSNKCYGISKRGYVPWNKGTRGICKPNSGSFKKGNFVGNKNPSWKNGRNKSLGYILVYAPNHPYRHKRRNKVAEHRLIIENIIKKYLKPREVVHHINRIKDDNRPENLIAFSTDSAHQRFHKNPENVEHREIIFDGRLLVNSPEIEGFKTYS